MAGNDNNDDYFSVNMSVMPNGLPSTPVPMVPAVGLPPVAPSSPQISPGSGSTNSGENPAQEKGSSERNSGEKNPYFDTGPQPVADVGMTEPQQQPPAEAAAAARAAELQQQLQKSPEKVAKPTQDNAKAAKRAELMQAILKEVEDIEWYHGGILDEDIRTVLNKNGDFMIRLAISATGLKTVVVTIILNNELENIAIQGKKFPVPGSNKKEMQYTLDNRTRGTSIKDLMKKHTAMCIPVMRNKQEIHLLNPIAKQSWELRFDNIELITKLGEGAFGEVHSGKLKRPLKKFCNVAVKVIKRTSTSDQATQDLHKEAVLMRKIKHNNIVRFYGMVIRKDTIMVVMELITGGGLDSYLKKHPTASIDERSIYAADIACGLAYLHGQGVVHRDIACRNVLLDLAKRVAKVSDFGLARVADEVKLRPDERIPIRWTAPEVVKTLVYTRAADIYAYAILVYEIFANAAMPFEGFTNAQIKDGIQKDDFRPKFPPTTPPEIVEMIAKCWLTDPAQRTPLADVAKLLTTMTAKMVRLKARTGPSGGKKNPSRQKSL